MEFSPIFQAGFHDIKIEDFDEIFVYSFENNGRRMFLRNRFFALIEEFKQVGLDAEIWLDGSFSTRKEEPDDIDILFVVDEEKLNSLPFENYQIIESLFDREETKIRYNCDLFLIMSNSFNDRSYWRGWFGFTREEQPKGIPRLKYVANS